MYRHVSPAGGASRTVALVAKVREASRVKLRPCILVCAAVLTALGGCDAKKPTTAAPAAGAAEKSDWLTNFKQAQAKAKADGKLLLVDFTGSDWCPPCIMLDRQVFSRPEFAEYARKNLVLLKIDFPRRRQLSNEQKVHNDDLAYRFRIEVFPTIVLLDSQGRQVGQLGYMPGGPAAFIAELERLRAQS